MKLFDTKYFYHELKKQVYCVTTLSRMNKRRKQIEFFQKKRNTCVVDPDPYVLGLPDPNLLVRGTDPGPSIIKQNLLFGGFFLTFNL
jgi:hypothetical protein